MQIETSAQLAFTGVVINGNSTEGFKVDKQSYVTKYRCPYLLKKLHTMNFHLLK